MSVSSLLDFPEDALSNLLYFLPQDSLLNLALTNFHFYEPCLKRLYQRLVIQTDPALRSNSLAPSDYRRDDFLESSASVVAGFSNIERPKSAHWKMVEARVRTLSSSIQVNPQLAQYIESIEVEGTFNRDVENAIHELLLILSTVPVDIKKIYISDQALRKRLDFVNLSKKFPSLTTICVDSLEEFPALETFPNLNEIVIADVLGDSTMDANHIQVLTNIEHLLVRSTAEVSDTFFKSLWSLYKQQPFMLSKLKTFTAYHSYENQHKYPYIDFSGLENFQISLGCNDVGECDSDCLENCLTQFHFTQLKRLAVIQNSDPIHNNHRYSEIWDLAVFNFVKQVVENSDTLIYLSIRHNVPADGVIDDGFEGNYLRKVKLYTNLLPNLLATLQKHVVNLMLPNLVACLSCYEQPMNTFMWNGCKCPHCDKYLTKLDDYLLHHRYYSFEKQVFKDVLTVQLMRTMSEVLADRVVYDLNYGDLFQLRRPLRNLNWNFHDSKFSIPFRCLPVKTYEIADFEDEKAELKESHERFFDAEEHENDCQFLRKESFVPDYSVVVSHFLNDLIRKMINLNRGDAEDVLIGQEGDENDGFTNLRINKMLINGINFNFDHEINGTIFFKNVYDELDDFDEEINYEI
ncbi:hypothetical protein FT663_03272 [Candidozyma haemuli var. vulneris]|nr:hypothetical protein FT663_03272 [[Candida] haemuloni var. vulneris]KAF3990521.1 hypothetical protein FT662_02206 [[Candida] haemuloni var. vulneris]